jgi:hypothetical protein
MRPYFLAFSNEFCGFHSFLQRDLATNYLNIFAITTVKLPTLLLTESVDFHKMQVTSLTLFTIVNKTVVAQFLFM